MGTMRMIGRWGCGLICQKIRGRMLTMAMGRVVENSSKVEKGWIIR